MHSAEDLCFKVAIIFLSGEATHITLYSEVQNATKNACRPAP